MFVRAMEPVNMVDLACMGSEHVHPSKAHWEWACMNKMRGHSIAKSCTSIVFVLIIGTILCINCDPANRGEEEAGCHDHEREALIKFRSRLEYESYHQIASWDQSGDCCKWGGVKCDNQTGYVLELNLRPPLPGSSTLSGQLDPALLELKHLHFLDLSSNSFNIPIPTFLGSLNGLRYLNLSYSSFLGEIPHQLGNLSNLEHLHLGETFESYLSTDTFHWLEGMPQLKALQMNAVNLSEIPPDWVHILSNLYSLHELVLPRCNIHDIAQTVKPTSFISLRKLDLSFNWIESNLPTWIANISNLEYLDLSHNSFLGVIPHGLSELPHLEHLSSQRNFGLTRTNCTTLLQGSWRSIKSLDLKWSRLYGQLPSSLGNLSSLVTLDLAFNGIDGRIPETIGAQNCRYAPNGSSCTHPATLLPNLQVLYIEFTRISGTIPNWLGKLRSLQELDMSNCNLSGPIPATFGELSSLRTLDLENNRLTGTIPTNLWNLSQLENLAIGMNSLMGFIGVAQLNQLKNLKVLDLSLNAFVLHLESDWVPAFQLYRLYLEACSLGPSFPQWLITQKSLSALVMRNTSIEDSLPSWFWDFSFQLWRLDLSHNKIKGLLPKSWNYSSATTFDISNNQFSGPLPQEFKSSPYLFSISKNQINGTIPNSICTVGGSLIYLDLSQNHIIGNIPTSLSNCSRLEFLDLSENLLTGELPWSLGKLSRLNSLYLGKNELSGMISSSLSNCSQLKVLDLGENNLSGNLSPLVHNIFVLMRALTVQSNMFTGSLPSNLSNMSSLQILDVSDNHLSGLIPRSIGEFAMLVRRLSVTDWGFNQDILTSDQLSAINSRRFEKLWLSFKGGRDLLYDNNIYLVGGMDLSSNGFYGEIPEELTRLKGLVFLNLSNNNLTSIIPENIGQLNMLESLDLSNNQLEGEIPGSLSQLTFLGRLNLSNNHLRGRIPFGGQLQILGNSSIYEGNIGLCGPPLEKQCVAGNNVPVSTQEIGDEKGDDHEMWFYMSIVFGFVFGFWAIYGLLIFKKSARIAFNRFFDASMEKLIDILWISVAKLKAIIL